MCKLFILLSILMFNQVLCNQEDDTQTETIVSEVSVLVGGEAELPCDVTPPKQSDALNMVMWFKDDEGTPIYSLDCRESPPRHWTGVPSLRLGSRVRFQLLTTPASLFMEEVTSLDEGVYRCRVDFRNSPTVNTRVVLNIVVPPSQLMIIDSSGMELDSVVGPLIEGFNLVLTCQVYGGRPLTALSWWQGHDLLDSMTTLRADGFLVSQLHVVNVSREHRRMRYKCEASNSNLIPPLVSKDIRLDVYVKPASIEIQSDIADDETIPEGTVAEWKCTSIGAYPGVRLAWWIGEEKTKEQYFTVSSESQSTTLSMRFIAKRSDDGKDLTCIAENHWVENSQMEVKRKMKIVYAPVSMLKLGNGLEEIKEGDDVYFECFVKANPSVQKIIWQHDGVEIHQNKSGGIIFSNRSLALQKVTLVNAGLYTCVAINSQGEGASNQLRLKIHYSPRCASARKEGIQGALKHETVLLQCQVEADPYVTEFSWTFNRSKEVLSVPRFRYSMSSETGTSNLTFTPVDDMDYGTLACWAKNSVGQQGEPCVFHIIPAGPPHPVEECISSSPFSGELEVKCVSGFDGGLPQHYQLELNPQKDEKCVVRIYRWVSVQPVFLIRDLEPECEYTASIFAVNAKGRSLPVYLERLQLPGLQKYTDTTNKSHTSDFFSLLVPLGGTAILIILIILLAATLLCIRRQSNPDAEYNDLKRPKNELGKDSLDLLEGNPLLNDRETTKLTDSISNFTVKEVVLPIGTLNNNKAPLYESEL